MDSVFLFALFRLEFLKSLLGFWNEDFRLILCWVSLVHWKRKSVKTETGHSMKTTLNKDSVRFKSLFSMVFNTKPVKER